MSETGYIRIPVQKDIFEDMPDWEPLLALAREAAAAEGAVLIEKDDIDLDLSADDVAVFQWEMERIVA